MEMRNLHEVSISADTLRTVGVWTMIIALWLGAIILLMAKSWPERAAAGPTTVHVTVEQTQPPGDGEVLPVPELSQPKAVA